MSCAANRRSPEGFCHAGLSGHRETTQTDALVATPVRGRTVAESSPTLPRTEKWTIGSGIKHAHDVLYHRPHADSPVLTGTLSRPAHLLPAWHQPPGTLYRSMQLACSADQRCHAVLRLFRMLRSVRAAVRQAFDENSSVRLLNLPIDVTQCGGNRLGPARTYCVHLRAHSHAPRGAAWPSGTHLTCTYCPNESLQACPRTLLLHPLEGCLCAGATVGAGWGCRSRV